MNKRIDVLKVCVFALLLTSGFCSASHALPVVSPMSAVPAIPEQYNCITCHLDMEDETITPPVNEWKESVHRTAGVMCHDCHGGNPADDDLAMDPDESGFTGKPEPQDIPELCAKCHADAKKMRQYNKRADQYALYSGSVHGRKLAKGDIEAPSCVSCHGKHKILRVKDPQSMVNRNMVIETCGGCHSDKAKFEKRRKPFNQLALYKKSRHYDLLSKGDLLVPTCVDCHGNHGVLSTKSERVRTVCFKCHGQQAEAYKQSPHFKAYKEEGEPLCFTCHNNHDVEKPGVAKFSGENDNDCIGCHDEKSKAYLTGIEIQSALTSTISALQEGGTALADLKENGHGGFETSSLEEKIAKAHENLTELHSTTHGLNVETIKKDSEKIIQSSQSVSNKVASFWAEIKTRHRGLAVAWIVFLGFGYSLFTWSRVVDKQRDE